jgi:SAM-dependent methyltransferase
MDKYITDNFIDIKLNLNNLWLYQMRKNLHYSMEKNSHVFYGKVLDLGCGVMPYKKIILQNSRVSEYIGLDLENTIYYSHIKPDLVWNGELIPLEDNSVECVIATEVLEHCFEPEKLLNEIYRVLKPGGLIYCTVPFVWHLHEVPYDAFRYTPFSLTKKLKDANFNKITITSLGGWDSALSQLLGLWITFRPMKRVQKSILLRLIWLAIKILEKKDKKPTSFDNKANSMVSGLLATGIK